jgi:hypothetical protein
MTIKWKGKPSHHDTRCVAVIWPHKSKRTFSYSDIHDNHVYEAKWSDVEAIVSEPKGNNNEKS